MDARGLTWEWSEVPGAARVTPTLPKAPAGLKRDLDALSRRWVHEGQEFDCTTRIGIHTGEVVVGNFGTPERMNYTAFGANVNSASRLEGINKYYGTRILITDATLAQVPGAFLTRLVDRAVLSGMSGAIGIHELIGRAAEASATERELATQYETAFALYSERRFEEAERGFEALLSQFPGDKPAELMVQRCRDYAITPPPPEWTGEHVFMRK